MRARRGKRGPWGAPAGFLAPPALLLLLLAACSAVGEKSVGPGSEHLRPDATPLDRYVHAPDAAYAYEPVRDLEGEGCVAHVLKMTSQNWLTPRDVDRTLWWHWLTIIEPERIGSDVALLYIGGGRNNDPPPDRVDASMAKIARSTGTVVVHLMMVPNQPLTFADDDAGPRKEDQLIALSWNRFLRGGDPAWLARLPMTKSAVRAMDTVTDFFARRGRTGPRIGRFVVAGSSKRGWTTWLTAAVDARVVAIVPMVIDLLNLETSFRHHFEAYGFWAPAIKSYVDMEIPSWFGTPEMRRLQSIVDPYEYRSRLTLPKFLINATGDQFFLPDSSRFYYHDLLGEKHLRYVPNADHSLNDTDARESLLAFYQAVVIGAPRPDFSWSFEPDGSIRVQTDGRSSPSSVLLWQATNPAARDFRLESIGKAWKSSVLEPREGTYVGRVPAPDTGWTAFFIELTYPGSGEEPFRFTSEVRVVPDTLPFAYERR